ncbi:MAG TPA: GNAT family N-acetyltransferase [Acidimicrobiales bacterium]|nr:GNAT family N-acetyltransferase [Acidimicrobiales bacterium]
MPDDGPANETVEFRPCHPDQEPARSLIAAMVGELRELYGIGDGGRLGVALEPAELAPPGGVYLVGWQDGRPVAGGGLRTIGAGMGEIKRMYVVPGQRGRGTARLLLGALEGRARALGMTAVRLDTGHRQPHARHLYETSGYAAVENYNGNGHAAFWGEKAL